MTQLAIHSVDKKLDMVRRLTYSDLCGIADDSDGQFRWHVFVRLQRTLLTHRCRPGALTYRSSPPSESCLGTALGGGSVMACCFFFRIMSGGLAGARSSRPSFGCNEAR